MQLSRTRLQVYTVLVFILIFSLGTFSWAACGGETPTTTQPTTTTTTQPTTSAPPTTTTTTPTTTTTQPTTTAEPHPGLPLVSFDSGSFVGSANCGLCHTNQTDANGSDVSIQNNWRSTIMANAARDPYFRAKVSAEILNAPHLQGVIEDVCATCHTPMARTQAVADGTESLLFGSGFLNESNALHNAGIDGVSCTVCHQVQPTGLGTEETFAGGYIIDTSTTAPNRIAFSQFADPQQQLMMSASGFKPVQGEHLGESGVCGTCHTVITPYIDSEGNVQGTFPEQVPFLEWSHSSYSGQMPCQGCHMPPAAGPVPTANMPANLEGKSPFAKHFFVGGNSQMLEIYRDNPEELAVTASTEYFNGTIARVFNQLEKTTAGIEIVQSNISGNTLTADIKISSQAGHKLPTGFPSRRIWVHMTVTDGTGNIVFESGKVNADGSITGNAADEDIYDYEAHYDTITSADQVQIYEAIMLNMDGGVNHKLLEAASYAKDNRLLPAGFDKNTAEEIISVWGAASGDDDFIGGSDTVTYQIDTTGFAGPFTISVELLYQSLAYSSIQSISGVDTPEVGEFMGYFDSSDKAPTLIVSATQQVS